MLPRAAMAQIRPESLPQGFVIIVADESQQANASNPIYMASGANSWDPGDPEWVFSPRSDKRWQLVVPGGKMGEKVEFKLTLGGWNRVETDPEGQDIANRVLPDVDADYANSDKQPILELTVPQFRTGDQGFVIASEYQPYSVTGTVKRLQVAGGAGRASRAMRDLQVWLPPGYDDPENKDRTYPVLYLFDGQNLFQDHSGIPDEWHADETATALIEAGVMEPIIIVGVPHGGGMTRLDEYTPTLSSAQQVIEKYDANATASGNDFLHWMGTEVLPRVERAFRVSPDREDTAVGGASLGGSIALYAGLRHADQIGKVLAESPALQVFDESLMDLAQTVSDLGGDLPEFYIGMGGREKVRDGAFFNPENRKHVDAASGLYDRLNRMTDASLVVVDRHEHNEIAWSERFPLALTTLFPPRNGQQGQADPAIEAEPQPEVKIAAESLAQGFTIVVEDTTGMAKPTRPIYLASNHNGWNPGDGAQRLRRKGDGTWSIDIDQPSSDEPMRFKFTLGDWNSVESAINGDEIEDRALPEVSERYASSEERPVLRFIVSRFRVNGN